MKTYQCLFCWYFITPSTPDFDYPFRKLSKHVCTKRSDARCLSWWCRNAEWRQWRWRLRSDSPLGGISRLGGGSWNAGTTDSSRRDSKIAYSAKTALSVVWRLENFCPRPSVSLACRSNWRGDNSRPRGERAHCLNQWPAWPFQSSDRTTWRRTIGSFWPFEWGNPGGSSGGTPRYMNHKLGKASAWGGNQKTDQSAEDSKWPSLYGLAFPLDERNPHQFGMPNEYCGRHH